MQPRENTNRMATPEEQAVYAQLILQESIPFKVAVFESQCTVYMENHKKLQEMMA